MERRKLEPWRLHGDGSPGASKSYSTLPYPLFVGVEQRYYQFIILSPNAALLRSLQRDAHVELPTF